jgi:type IV pilus assembly protein PilW
MTSNTTRRNAGFSLIELMISVLLGVILMAGASSIYLASKRSYQEVEQVAALAENANYAEQVVTEALRHVGFLGEQGAGSVSRDPTLKDVFNDCTDQAEAYDLGNYLFATQSDGNGDAFGCIDDAAPNSQILVVKSVIPQPFTDGPRVPDLNATTSINGTIDTPRALSTTATYILSNNATAILFDGGAASPPTVVTGGDVPGGAAWEYKFEVYYIRQVSTDPNAPRRLSRKVLSWDAANARMEVVTEDVVDGVERMYLRFGFDSTNDDEVDTYANVATIGNNWDRIQSIEVYMLVRSAIPDPEYVNEKAYQLGDLSVAAADDNFRRLVTRASISLRNPKLLIRGGA